MEYKPHDYQQFAINYILEHPIAAVILGMGLGKTSITLTAIEQLIYDSFEVSKVLVVAPLRVARNTWSDEIHKWNHLKHLRYSIVLGSAAERKKALEADADIYIINRENLQWLIEQSGVNFFWDMVVLDELSSFKNWNSKRFKAFMKVRPKVKRVIGLTGTPSSNGLMDLFAEFKCLDMGERLGRFISQYRVNYFVPDRMNGPIVYSYKLRNGAEEQIYEKISDITISMKALDHLQMPELIMGATKRIVNYSNAGYYQVLSAEVGGKHGFSVSGLVFDEIHTQPNRQLYDVLTKGSSDARQNPLHFIITTAGNDRHSIAYELHTKAVDILEGRRVDPTFYPVVYGLKDDEDWEDEENWYKVNPSLGYTVDIERLRDAYREAKQNPADEVTFKWLRCNMWVSSTVAWIPDAIYMRGNESIEAASLEGRDCYAGLDLSSTGDITALVLIFPPRDENEKYVLLPYFWIPEETIPRRVKANSVPYDIWEKQGYIMSTEGNVIHYDFIEKFIMYLSEKYHILEIAVDRWNATQMIQNLEGEGFTIVPFGQGFSSMSAPTKEFYRLLMEGRIIHGGNPVLRWMAGNVVIDTDPAGNIKVTKAKSKEKIDGIVAAIMALDRCIRQEGQSGSVYDERGLLVF